LRTGIVLLPIRIRFRFRYVTLALCINMEIRIRIGIRTMPIRNTGFCRNKDDGVPVPI